MKTNPMFARGTWRRRVVRLGRRFRKWAWERERCRRCGSTCQELALGQCGPCWASIREAVARQMAEEKRQRFVDELWAAARYARQQSHAAKQRGDGVQDWVWYKRETAFLAAHDAAQSLPVGGAEA